VPRTAKGEIDYAKDFFARPTYLTVSGQLEAEAFALSLSKVYTFGPTFRAENSNTSRHSNEFWMIEPEMAFYDLYDNMTLAEAFIKRLITDALTKCAEDMKFFEERIDKECLKRAEAVLKTAFLRVTYTEAIDTFVSPETGPLGMVDLKRVIFYRRPIHRWQRDSQPSTPQQRSSG
jgi:asparaginyl-tRNA synthetase